MPQYFRKQPAETLDYDFDWSEWLEPTAGDTISSSVVTASAGITLGTKIATTTAVKQFISGGTDGEEYKVTCTITTVEGRVDQEEIWIQVRDL